MTAIAVWDSTVYFGTDQMLYCNGEWRNRAAAVDAASAALTPWDPSIYYPISATVNALAADGVRYMSEGASPRLEARSDGISWRSTVPTGQLLSWNPGADRPVKALAADGSTIYAGGDFSIIGGKLRYHLAAVDSLSGAATSWAPWTDDAVNAICVNGSTVYVTGSFHSVSGTTRYRVAALDAATGSVQPWNPAANDTVVAVATGPSQVYLGGWFFGVGGSIRNCIASLDPTTGAAVNWNPDSNGSVNAFGLARVTGIRWR